ncbi:MAG: DHA2 family efflux MFS transporter permease subunit [Acidimicrobiales bacterium]|nr:DHA2 family efflux MFS transporter permease subunit [Acidimicrobiales bacterium]
MTNRKAAAPTDSQGEPIDYEGIDPDVYNRRWAILAVLCTSLMIVIIGNTSLNVAIPTLGKELNASLSALQWMVDAYSLLFAGLLFTAGTLGDRFGRKGALQGGLVLFLIGALVASVAETSGTVIAGRAIMGVAAAFVMPSTLSILTNVFPARERPKAIAMWAGISGGGAALGPIASGFLLEHFHWGWVFRINVPIIIGALVAGALIVPKSKDPEEQPLDLPGAALSIVGLGALVYAIIEAPHDGWLSTHTLGMFAVAAIAIALFIRRELHTPTPMLDLRLFKDRRFSVASGGMTLTFFAMFGTFFLVAQYFQLVLGYSPLESGLLQLPMAFIMMGVAPQAPKLVARFGVNRVVPAGLAATAAGLLVFSRMQVDSSLWFIYLSVVPLALGMALTMTPLTTLIMSSVPLNRAGVGSAMNDTTRELGGALGVAILGSILTSVYTSDIAPLTSRMPSGPARSAIESGLPGAVEVARQAPPAMAQLAEQALDSAKHAFVDGMSLAALIGSIIVVLAIVLTYRLLPSGDAALEGTGARNLDPIESETEREALATPID